MIFFLYVTLASFLLISQIYSQDPFLNSGCTCDTFCDYKCSINATAPTNMTFYRMTMEGVYDLKNKNTGDVMGDTSFVLERKNTYIGCRKNPNQLQCKDVAQFSGDDANSTDEVLEFTVEVDG